MPPHSSCLLFLEFHSTARLSTSLEAIDPSIPSKILSYCNWLINHPKLYQDKNSSPFLSLHAAFDSIRMWASAWKMDTARNSAILSTYHPSAMSAWGLEFDPFVQGHEFRVLSASIWLCVQLQPPCFSFSQLVILYSYNCVCLGKLTWRAFHIPHFDASLCGRLATTQNLHQN